MGGRTHDHHCRNCHTWVDGFAVDDGATCGCGDWDGFYDLNNEGCEGGCPELRQCEAELVVAEAVETVHCNLYAGHKSYHKAAVWWKV